jgi:hypothetical protein
MSKAVALRAAPVPIIKNSSFRRQMEDKQKQEEEGEEEEEDCEFHSEQFGRQSIKVSDQIERQKRQNERQVNVIGTG